MLLRSSGEHLVLTRTGVQLVDYVVQEIGQLLTFCFRPDDTRRIGDRLPTPNGAFDVHQPVLHGLEQQGLLFSCNGVLAGAFLVGLHLPRVVKLRLAQ